MKYFSEVTNKVYDTVNELKEAEAEVTSKVNARKADAEKVEAAYKACVDARVAYEKELSEFCKKYGAYHKTFNADNIKGWTSLSEMVSDLLI
jgi:hypothetical protein